MKNTRKPFPEEAWENRELGADEKYVRRLSPAREKAIDDSLNLQMISIRLQKDVVAAIKKLAKKEGIGYQPYIRQLLTQHIKNKKV